MGFIDPHMPDPGRKDAPIAQTNAAINPAQNIINSVLEARERIAMVDALSGVLGNKQQPTENLGSSVLNKSLEVMQNQNAKIQEMASKREGDVTAARAEADRAKEAVYNITAGQISGAIERLEKMQDEMKRGAPQKSLLEQLDEARKIGAIINPQPAAPPPPPANTDLTATLTLERMKMEHEATMKRLDIELAKMNQDLQIRLAEFTDKKQQRKEDFESSNAIKTNALNTLSDIAAAASAGLRAKTGGTEVAAQAEAVEQPPVSGEPEIKAYIKSFLCQGCGERVAIPPSGNIVTCPGCKSEYELAREEAA